MYLLVFHAYINEMHGSRSQISSKFLVRRRCAERFNSGVRGLNVQLVFPQGVLFVDFIFHLALHVSANAIFRSTTVSWQPLVCGWFSVFVIFIVISLYMFRLTPSSGAQLCLGSHWCVDGFLFL